MKKIGFIGAGNMATAIIGSLMGQNDGKADFINVFDLDKEKCDIMSKKGINIKKSAADVMLESNITVLAVKPQNYPEVLEALKPQVTADKVFVSIAAGISISYVQNLLDCKCPVVRVMRILRFCSARVRLHFARQIISPKKTNRLFIICLRAAAFVNILQKSI